MHGIKIMIRNRGRVTKKLRTIAGIKEQIDINSTKSKGVLKLLYSSCNRDNTVKSIKPETNILSDRGKLSKT